jgi:hypothetical protein
MTDLYTRVAGLVPRLSRRLPVPLRCQSLEHRLGDWLAFKSATTSSRTRELEAARRSCGSDESWFAFASEVFPSHQQRGEILDFIRLAGEREPRVAMDIVPDSETRCGIKTGNWTGEVPKFWAALKPHYESHEFVVSPDQDGFGIGVIVHRQGGRVPD